METQRVQMKGVIPSRLAPWACSAGTRDFFHTVHYFSSLVLIAQQTGRAAVLGQLSLSMILWSLLQYSYALGARG
jgi:hypothetical protein